MDIDKSGAIDLNEFVMANLNWKTNLTEEKLKVAFELFDLDRSGFITCDEIKTVLGNGDEEIDENVW